jgi:curved DNA-binding protein CbpA
MKETFYFSHDYNAQQDPKMVELWGECGLEGVGFYWILIEHLHAETAGKITESQLQTLLKMYGKFQGNEQVFNKIQQVLNSTKLLLKDENGMYYSGRVLRHKKERENLSLMRSRAGKKSAEVRLNPTRVQQGGEQVLNNIKERKGKESKENITPLPPLGDFDSFWKLYPNKTGKGAALKSWRKLKSAERDKCIEVLPSHCSQQKWLKDDGQYIPNPATWLNQRRWEDETGGPAPVSEIEARKKLLKLRESFNNSTHVDD